MGRFYTYPNYKDITKMVYTIPEIKEILGFSRGQTYRLLESEPFPIIRAVRKKLIPIAPFHKWVQATYPHIELPTYSELPKLLINEKKSYSVPEVQAMLGMKKTSSYEMIKIGTFKTIMVNNHIRVLRSSFDEWFHSQDNKYIEEKEI